jgi:two-component system chemotaxis sensor kinase CheA
VSGSSPIDVRQFLPVFLEEVAEHLATLESGLVELETVADPERVNEVFRAVHSIKGAAAPFGFLDVARAAHVVESILARVREGTLEPGRPVIGGLLRGADLLRELVDAATDGRPAPDDLDQVLAGIEAASLAPAAGPGPGPPAPAPRAALPAPEPARFRITFRPGSDLLLRGLDPVLLLRELATAGEASSVALDAGAVPSLDSLDPEACYLRWTVELATTWTEDRLRSVFEFADDGGRLALERLDGPGPAVPAPPVQPTVRAAARAPADAPPVRAESIRVHVSRVDELMNMVGELVIAQSMMSASLTDASADRMQLVEEAVEVLERNTRALQECVMAIRMVPVGTVFSRLGRLVRDGAAALGKQVVFHMSGQETELDKTVVERIADPLTHLIRNSLDHGIESPGERRARGKPAEGAIRLGAYHEGGNVVIELADDGGGLDTDRIRAKALALGLLAGPDASDDQVHACIFAAGFSTAASVSQLSGRGVGMDVVRGNVEALSGSIAIHSVRGQGVRFRVVLPLTLAILDGMCLGVGDQLYVLPLSAIVTSLLATPEVVRTAFGRGEMVVIGGQAIPLVRLANLLGVGRPAPATPPLVVVVQHEGRRIGLGVDELLGQLQVVVKSLEANYHPVDGLMGATILGDGRVSFILDVQGLCRLANLSPALAPVVRVSHPGRQDRRPPPEALEPG